MIVNVWYNGHLLWGLDGEELEEGLVCSPPCCCFFWRAREFWNHTCVTRLLRPVIWAMRSKSWPSGLLSNWKLACSTCSWSSVNVVRTRFAFDFWLHSESKKKLLFIISQHTLTQARQNRGFWSLHLKIAFFKNGFINKKINADVSWSLHFLSWPFTLNKRCYMFDTQCQNISHRNHWQKK